jgi:hypothetical protein
MSYSKLIISPHADDEVIGCSSVLDKDSFVYVCGVDEQTFPIDGIPKKIPWLWPAVNAFLIILTGKP